MEEKKHHNPNDKAKHKPKNSYTEKLKRASKPSPRFKDKGGGEKSKDGESAKSSYHGRHGGGAERNQRQQGQGQFPEYLLPPLVIAGLNNKTLIEGVLRINAKSYEDAFISSPDPKEQDIYIKVILHNYSLNECVLLFLIVVSGYFSEESGTERGCCRGEPRLSGQVEGQSRSDPGLCRDAGLGGGEECPDGQLRGQCQGGDN